MCLIIHRPANGVFDTVDISNTHWSNSDGFGIMWCDGDRVQVKRIVSRDKLQPIFDLYNEFEGKEIGIHFRMRTHGDVDDRNCHPYEVLNKDKGHPYDLFLMHNGIINGLPELDPEMSDTWHFIEVVLRPLLLANPEYRWNDEFWSMIGKMIGKGSKFLLLDSDGYFHFVNKDEGWDRKGCWLSNTYAMSDYDELSSYYYGNFTGRSVYGGMAAGTCEIGNTTYNYQTGEVAARGKSGVKSAAESAEIFREGSSLAAIREVVEEERARGEASGAVAQGVVPRLVEEEDDEQQEGQYFPRVISHAELLEMTMDDILDLCRMAPDLAAEIILDLRTCI